MDDFCDAVRDAIKQHDGSHDLFDIKYPNLEHAAGNFHAFLIFKERIKKEGNF